MSKLGDFDRWFKPCDHCGHDAARVSEKTSDRCWKCGRHVFRDFSDRALKSNRLNHHTLRNDK